MVEGVLGEDVEMGKEVFGDSEFLERVRAILVNNRVKKIRREELREFLENVKAILVNPPNEFVTIKEIANNKAIKEITENKWKLCSDPDYAVMWFLCHPIGHLSPHILCIECRDHEDYARWALKYNPDRQKDHQERKGCGDSVRRNQLIQELRQLQQEIYDLTIIQMVDFFPDRELEEELKRRDRLLDEFEETQRRLRRCRMEENRGRRDI